MKTIENSETTWQSEGGGGGRLPAVSEESSSSQLADTPACLRPPALSHSNWLNWLRLLISIKAFNRQAPQTAGNILFIWGFCLHNRQASQQAAHNFNNPPSPLCAPAPLRSWYTLNCPPGPVACELRREIFAPNFLLFSLSLPAPLKVWLENS